MPLALGLQAQMRPCFFTRPCHGPATDQPGQHLLRCLVQVGRQQGLWLKALVWVANAAPSGWAPAAYRRDTTRPCRWPLPPRGGRRHTTAHGQLAPRRVLIGQRGLQGRPPVSFQPGSPDCPGTCRGWIIEGGVETQPCDQTGTGHVLTWWSHSNAASLLAATQTTPAQAANGPPHGSSARPAAREFEHVGPAAHRKCSEGQSPVIKGRAHTRLAPLLGVSSIPQASAGH